jgi:hypothetical protein
MMNAGVTIPVEFSHECTQHTQIHSSGSPEISRSVREPKIAPGGHTDDRKRYGCTELDGIILSRLVGADTE